MRARADVLLATCLMAAGAALRLARFSGFGLGDDNNLLYFVRAILDEHRIPADNLAYRFTWWLPALVSCRVFGRGEGALILPFTLVDALGIGLVYALGRKVHGRCGGIVAALLVIANPLDFAWATMMTNDLFVSFFSGLALLCTLVALEAAEPRRRSVAWAGAALSLWLAFHAKVSGLVMAPVILFAAWRHRDRLDGRERVFVATAAALFAASAVVSYALAGDPIAPYHVELAAQGVTAPEAAVVRPALAHDFWMWRDVLFRADRLGDRLFSFQPHVLLVLVLAAPRLGLRLRAEVAAWLAVTAIVLHFHSLRWTEGGWTMGFRNVRHAHAFVYPIALLLAGLVCGLRVRAPRWVDFAVAALVAIGLWQSFAAASKTRIAFADQRAACRLLAGMPFKPLHSDFQLKQWARLADLGHDFRELSPDPAARQAAMSAVHGYVVTGGAREPLYGCVECIPRADELRARTKWLLLEVAGPPPSWWRPEPLRVWYVE